MKRDYFIEQYSTDSITLSIDAEIPDHSRTSIDLRALSAENHIPNLQRADIQGEIIRLFQLGFDYFDIGKHSDWIAAEMVIEKKISQKGVEEAITLLRSIKSKLCVTEKKKTI